MTKLISPFNGKDADRFNSLTHFPISANKLNDEFNSQSDKYYSAIQAGLNRWGISEIPEDAQQALERVQKAMYALQLEFIRAREIAPPWTVTGRANYSKFANPDRARRVEENALAKLDAAKKYLAKVMRRYNPDAPISSDDDLAIEKLEHKILIATEMQEKMKAANKIIKNAKLSNPQKIEQLMGLAISEKVAEQLLKPDFAGRIGYADFELTNNRANIKRMDGRVEELKRKRAQATRVFLAGENKDIKVVDNVEENRLQIFFPGKPEQSMIDKLKQRGFKWAPSVNCWQRMRTGSANAALYDLLGRVQLVNPSPSPH